MKHITLLTAVLLMTSTSYASSKECPSNHCTVSQPTGFTQLTSKAHKVDGNSHYKVPAIKSDKVTFSQLKNYTDNSIQEQAKWQAHVDEKQDNSIKVAQVTATNAMSTAQSNTKAITRETSARISGDAATLRSAQAYADDGDATTLSSANSYTDQQTTFLNKRMGELDARIDHVETLAKRAYGVALVGYASSQISLPIDYTGGLYLAPAVATDGHETGLAITAGFSTKKTAVRMSVGSSSVDWGDKVVAASATFSTNLF